LSLPPLPPTEAVMYSTVRDAHSRAALKTLATTLRGTLGK
jgi:hypothetical protein